MTRPRIRSAASGRWKRGALLATITMLSWATLPLALKLALADLDLWTLTWFRFLVAACLMGTWIGRRGGLTAFGSGWSGTWALLLLAATGLTGNYVLYLMGLDRTTPAIAQVLIQLAPMLMAIGGIALFGERYSGSQWIGFVVLGVGLILFFRQQLALVATGSERLWQGALYILLSAIAWALYALAQKQLLGSLSSARTMVAIYLFASVTLFPASSPSTLAALQPVPWIIVGYCAVSTLISYGAFAEALNHWEASRVSAVLALTPIGTLVCAGVVGWLFPGSIPPENLDAWSLAGAGLVVAGSMTTSLAGRRPVRSGAQD